MKSRRRRRLPYGFLAGFLAFAGGWAVSAILTPAAAFPSYPRWQSTLWVYLGSHYIELSSVYTGGFGVRGTQPLELVTLPEWIYLVPAAAVGVASVYVCRERTSSKLKRNVSNALGAGTGYIVAGILAINASAIQPGISSILLVGGGIAVAIWLGSSMLGYSTRGMSFFGVASLGTVFAIGVVFLLGGLTVLVSIWGLVAIGAGTAVAVGLVFGLEGEIKQKGRHTNSDTPRLAGLKRIVESNWKELIAVSVVLLGLYVGLVGSV